MPTLREIRDEAWDASADAHTRMRREWQIYDNLEYSENERIITDLVPRAKGSLNPQIRSGILRLLSPFREQAVRIEIQPDRSADMEDAQVFTEDLTNWLEMMQSARREAESLDTFILHNLVGGMACAKTYFDTRTKVVRSDPVHPLTIAVDGAASRTDLSDAMAVCQRVWHDEFFLKRHYDWRPQDMHRHRNRYQYHRYNLPTHQLDEVWIRRELAADCEDIDGEMLDNTDKQMFRGVLIDDEVVEVTATPFWWPDFPYAFWRNFTSARQGTLATDFWGYGYGTLLYPQQKFLDEMLATLVATARNMPTGQVVTTRGALDRQQQYNVDGQHIELDVDTDVRDAFQHIPPFQISPIFAEMVQYVTQVMEEHMPSLSPVFTGEQAGANQSGRAINSRQWASFTQLSGNVGRLNEFREDYTRKDITLIQQTAEKPLSPHIWRGGLDLPQYFPEDARYVGFQLAKHDASAMPNSPSGRLEFALSMAAAGAPLTPEAILEFTGVDKGYGITKDMLLQIMPMPQGQQGNMNVMAGAEAPLP